MTFSFLGLLVGGLEKEGCLLAEPLEVASTALTPAEGQAQMGLAGEMLAQKELQLAGSVVQGVALAKQRRPSLLLWMLTQQRGRRPWEAGQLAGRHRRGCRA